MTVLYVCPAFPPEHSGAGVRIDRLARGLARRGIRATVIAPRRPGLPDRIERGGITVLRLGPSDPKGPLGELRFGLAVCRWIVRHRGEISLLYAQSLSLGHLPMGCLCRLLDLSAAMEMTLRGWDDPDAFVSGPSGWLRSLTYRAFPHHVALCPPQGDAHARRMPHLEPARVLPSGIDVERFRPLEDDERRAARRLLAVPEDAELLCGVGGLMHRKGVDIAVDLFLHIAPDRPRLHFAWVGPDAFPDGSHYATFASRMRRRLLAAGLAGRFHFLGRRNDVETVYGASDLFVLPSRREGLPSVLLEAMASGLGCVVSPLDGASAWALDGSGVVVEGEDPRRWATEIALLLDDPRRRRQLARAARERAVESFRLERVQQQFETALRGFTSKEPATIVPPSSGSMPTATRRWTSSMVPSSDRAVGSRRLAPDPDPPGRSPQAADRS